jgi:hypothetical protein
MLLLPVKAATPRKVLTEVEIAVVPAAAEIVAAAVVVAEIAAAAVVLEVPGDSAAALAAVAIGVSLTT